MTISNIFQHTPFRLMKTCKILVNRIVLTPLKLFTSSHFTVFLIELKCCSSRLRRSLYHLNLHITKIKSILKRTTYIINVFILELHDAFYYPRNILLRYKFANFVSLEQWPIIVSRSCIKYSAELAHPRKVHIRISLIE